MERRATRGLTPPGAVRMTAASEGGFLADLHVHSRHARSTSRDLDLEHMAATAAAKGLAVIGTGDCVHPAWGAELREKLRPAGDGLFRLAPSLERAALAELPPALRTPPLFMLSVEISTIYKRADRTRKIHHLIYLPDFAAREALAARLGARGNIASDGRPILGLDSRDLLEITLEVGGYLVPAHIWTPWFSVLGAFGGFDTLEECYGALTPHIAALETGLSSDPAMNWRVGALDRYRLVSNSDAHSPGKLGREATRFACVPGFSAIRGALETGNGYGGTIEFFPEQGKYHADGHRACGVRLTPAQTREAGGRCPACGGKITVGVAHRVAALADRDAPAPPATAGAVDHLLPLATVLAETRGRGEASAAVAAAREAASAALGSEFAILLDLPLDTIAAHDATLAEAVRRLRAGTVHRDAGYDGIYGTVRLFAPGELRPAAR